ncbi:TRAP transporter small permease [Halomonas hibernica]|uniref:TRAP transporter small permease n=1 Tax=Halomonas hibernica TaxID=2591147 RepID=UPI001557CADA|nr:TRAP transporter small permease [Halomonas hibernica]
MALYRFFNKLDAVLTKVEERVVCFLIATMLTVVFLGVFNRTLIQLPIPWLEELARYLMIWAAFIGASLGVKRAVHISVDALIMLLPVAAQRLMTFIAYMASCILCAWLFYIGIEFVGRVINTGQLSPAMRIPMYTAYAAVPCGFLLMTFRFFLKCIFFFEKGNSLTSNEVMAEDGDKLVLGSKE